MLRKLYFANLILVVVALVGVMIVFGLFNESFLVGLMLPTALPMMAARGDLLSLWLLSPVYLAPLLIFARRRRKAAD